MAIDYSKIPETTRSYIKSYLDKGFTILPAKKKTKEPMIAWKPYQDRKPTDEEIQNWFSNNDVNITLLAGKVSNNLIVIDLDSNELYLKIFPPERAIEDNTLVVKTPRGYHVYFTTTDTTSHKYAGIDIIGDNHLVMVPPSIHPTGIEYKVISKTTNVANFPDLQTYLKKRLIELGIIREHIDEAIGFFSGLYPCLQHVISVGSLEGSRNQDGFKLVALLKALKRTPDEINRIMSIWNQNNGPSLSDTELMNLITSKVKYQHKCETLIESERFKNGCLPSQCKRRIKPDDEKKKQMGREMVEFLFESIDKMILYSNTDEAYSDFVMRDNTHLEVKVKDIMTPTSFAEQYLKCYNDFASYFRIRKIDEETWEEFLVKLNKEKFMSSNEIVDAKAMAIEIILQRLQDLKVTNILQEATEGRGGIFIDESNEAWVAVNTIQRIIDVENIRTPLIEISKAMKRYKKRHYQRRIGKKVYNGWILNREHIDIDEPEKEEDIIKEVKEIDATLDELSKKLKEILDQTAQDMIETEQFVNFIAEETKASREEIEKKIEYLKTKGDIYEPKAGFLALNKEKVN